MSESPHQEGKKRGFVTVRGTGFECDGMPFRFSGANNYYLGYKSKAMVDDVLDAARAMGLRVIRTWGFIDRGSLDGSVADVDPDAAGRGVHYQHWNPEAGAPAYDDGPDGLERLDYALVAAAKRDLRLIVSLVNNWQAFGGMDQYLTWYGLTHHDEFYTHNKPREAYRSWVLYLLDRTNTLSGTRYKDDPAIFAWELANEPRLKGTGSHPPSPSGSPATLVSWVVEMSAFIKEHDPRHLVAVGDEGFFNRPGSGDWTMGGGEGGDFDAFLEVPTVDFGTFHLYPEHWGKDPDWAVRFIEDHLASGREAGKPVVLEEYGFLDRSRREAVYARWLDTFYGEGGAAALVWMIAGRQDDGEVYPDYDGFTLYSDAVLATIRRQDPNPSGLVVDAGEPAKKLELEETR